MNAEFLRGNVFNTYAGKTRTDVQFYIKITVIDKSCENGKSVQLA